MKQLILNKRNMEKFNFLSVASKCRVMNPQDTMQLLKSRGNIVMCWGANKFTSLTNKSNTNIFGLRFKVSGYKHKGFVYITVNGSDLYDFYLVTSHGNLKASFTDIYFEDLVDYIDSEVETN